MNANKYFYLATVKNATSVTDCIKANFTLSPKSDEEIEALAKTNVGCSSQMIFTNDLILIENRAFSRNDLEFI